MLIISRATGRWTQSLIVKSFASLKKEADSQDVTSSLGEKLQPIALKNPQVYNITVR